MYAKNYHKMYLQQFNRELKRIAAMRISLTKAHSTRVVFPITPFPMKFDKYNYTQQHFMMCGINKYCEVCLFVWIWCR